MNGSWLPLILVLATAVQQIVGGVSCCCLSLRLLGSSSDSVVAKSRSDFSAPRPEKLRCSKCKPKSKLTVESKSQPLQGPAVSSDLCDCKDAPQALAFESELSKSHRSHQKSPLLFDTGFPYPPRSHLVALALDSSRNSAHGLHLGHLVAPYSIQTRLSWLGHWMI
jgi:hypothetical protein